MVLFMRAGCLGADWTCRCDLSQREEFVSLCLSLCLCLSLSFCLSLQNVIWAGKRSLWTVCLPWRSLSNSAAGPLLRSKLWKLCRSSQTWSNFRGGWILNKYRPLMHYNETGILGITCTCKKDHSPVLLWELQLTAPKQLQYSYFILVWKERVWFLSGRKKRSRSARVQAAWT